jgi:hypothetical protein
MYTVIQPNLPPLIGHNTPATVRNTGHIRTETRWCNGEVFPV